MNPEPPVTKADSKPDSVIAASLRARRRLRATGRGRENATGPALGARHTTQRGIQAPIPSNLNHTARERGEFPDAPGPAEFIPRPGRFKHDVRNFFDRAAGRSAPGVVDLGRLDVVGLAVLGVGRAPRRRARGRTSGCRRHRGARRGRAAPARRARIPPRRRPRPRPPAARRCRAHRRGRRPPIPPASASPRRSRGRRCPRRRAARSRRGVVHGGSFRSLVIRDRWQPARQSA